MADEPKGPTSPETRPESSAEKARSSSKPVSEDASASRPGQSELFPAQSPTSGAPANKPVASADKPFQVQPAAQTVARGDNSMLPPKADEPAKDCPVDAEGNLIEGDAPLTTSEGTDTDAALAGEKTDSPDPVAVETAKDPFEDDNPYHEEQTDYHHDDYHHDEHHDEYQYDDPYYGHDDPYHGDTGGGGLGLPPKSGDSGSNDDAPEEEEEYGGPVKGFLDHLEDLRWMLIKCAVSVVVCMTVCLVAGDKIVDILKYPLDQANGIGVDLQEQPSRLHLRFGTNEWFLPWTGEQNLGVVPLGTNIIKSLVVQPVQIGTNTVLALVPDPNPATKENKVHGLTVFGPMEAFSLIMDISLWGGLGLASPFVFFFVGQFVLPALRFKEKKWLYQGVIIGGGLFLLGVLFCYYTVMGVTLFASAGFAEWMGFQVDQWRASEYISFTMKFMIGMGISFELPIVLLTLVKVGLLSYERLAGIRSYMIVVLLVVSGFITPSGDPFSMVLMAAPLYVLYEISILVAWIWHKRELREQAAAEQAEREGL